MTKALKLNIKLIIPSNVFISNLCFYILNYGLK
jgi:hypothetical protein